MALNNEIKYKQLENIKFWSESVEKFSKIDEKLKIQIKLAKIGSNVLQATYRSVLYLINTSTLTLHHF